MIKKTIPALFIATLLVGCSPADTNTPADDANEVQQQPEEKVDEVVLTTADAQEQLQLSFKGYSGRGEMVVESDLEFPLNNTGVEVEQNGFLKNGDVVTLNLESGTDDNKFIDYLKENDYVLEDGFNPIYTVDGLTPVAETAHDITNLDDIIHMIDEDFQIQLTPSGRRTNYAELVGYWYRDFPENPDEGLHANSVGLLYAVYDMEREIEGKTHSYYVTTQGYRNILTDENGKANLADMVRVDGEDEFDTSVDTVVDLLESRGFEKVELK